MYTARNILHLYLSLHLGRSCIFESISAFLSIYLLFEYHINLSDGSWVQECFISSYLSSQILMCILEKWTVSASLFLVYQYTDLAHLERVSFHLKE